MKMSFLVDLADGAEAIFSKKNKKNPIILLPTFVFDNNQLETLIQWSVPLLHFD